MNSIFLNKVLWLFNYIIKAYKNSLSSSIVDKIQAFFKSIFEGSFIINAMRRDYGSIEDTKFYNKMLKPILSIRLFKDLISNSLILKFLTSTLIISILWGLQIISYGFMPTPFSLLFSIGLIILFVCRLAFKAVKLPSKSLVLSSVFILSVILISGLLNPLYNETITILMIFLVTILLMITFVITIDQKEIFYASLYTLAFTILLYSLYGIYQRIVGVTVDPSWLDEGSEQVMRIYSVFKNPNVFGEFLTLTLPLMFAGSQVSKKWTSKIFFFTVLLLGSLNILLSFSRGSMVSFAFAMFLLVLISDRKYLPLFFIGVLLSPFILPQSIWARLLTIVQGGDSSLDYRGSIYLASANMLKDHMILGVGLGNFKELYKVYAFTSSKTFHAHNTFLMIWLEMGILGIISWLAFAFMWIKNMFTMKKKDAYSYYSVAACVGVIGCSIQAMIEHIFHNYDILFYFFFVIAIGFFAVKLNKESADA